MVQLPRNIAQSLADYLVTLAVYAHGAAAYLAATVRRRIGGSR